MKQAFFEISVRTQGRGFTEITHEVQGHLDDAALATGLGTLFIQHTSASLLIQENADPDVRVDLEKFFQRMVPDGDPLFIHTAEGEDDMAAHLRTVLTTVQLSIPIRSGRLCLGTWQGIYVWEHRKAPHVRRVAIHFLGE